MKITSEQRKLVESAAKWIVTANKDLYGTESLATKHAKKSADALRALLDSHDELEREVERLRAMIPDGETKYIAGDF